MNRKAVEFAKRLTKINGNDEALRIALECSVAPIQDIMYSDEADFHVNQNGIRELAKHQSNKNTPRRESRIEKTKNFWKDVLTAITHKQV